MESNLTIPVPPPVLVAGQTGINTPGPTVRETTGLILPTNSPNQGPDMDIPHREHYPQPMETTTSETPPSTQSPPRHYPQRIRKPPEQL